MDILMQSMLVADARTKRSTMQLADWIFQPPASGYSLMDWQHFAEIAASGYDYASQVLLEEDARAAILGGRA
jgi:predicted acylesterase/phospholipase RssA